MYSILILSLLAGSVLCLENLEENENDYIDPVIDYLLNGGHLDLDSTENVEGAAEPILSDGIWKCGNCTMLDESALIYSEVNEVEDNLGQEDDNVEIQIGLTLQEMRCVTVSSSAAGVVRRVTGSCAGPAVTLNVAPHKTFTIHVYN